MNYFTRRTVRLWLVIVGLAAAITIALALFSRQFTSSPQSRFAPAHPTNHSARRVPDQEQPEGFAIASDLPSCQDAQILFTTPPLRLTDITHITPLGLLSPTAHTLPAPHVYLRVRLQNPSDQHSLPVTAPAVAPGDMVIREIALTENKTRPDFTDADIKFALCRDAIGYLDHLKTLAPKLQTAYDAGQTIRCDEYTLTYPAPIGRQDWRFCRRAVNLKLSAGEPLGTAGGGEGQRILDFGLFDQRIPPDTPANPQRWSPGREHFPYVTCALHYFPQPLRQQLEAMLGDGPQGQGPRTIEPRCGEVIQDIAGTAQGTWVPREIETIGHEPPLLALVHDFIDPRMAAFSVGESLVEQGLPHGLYYFSPRASGLVNRDFADIKPDGNVHCFETIEQQGRQNQPVTILASLPDPTTLRVGPGLQSGCGPGPWTLQRFVEFYR